EDGIRDFHVTGVQTCALPIFIAGAGNLGMALADYAGFNDHGFEIAALVDNDPSKIGRRSRSGIEVLSWDELPSIIRERQVDIGKIGRASCRKEWRAGRKMNYQ